MDIRNIYDDAKKALADFRREQRFRRQNKERKQSIELLDSMAKCRGKLEICRTSFDRSIRNQSRFVQEGLREGMDTLLQEQILWDAALGYMLVRDAMYALKSINTYDSVDHAYELLDEAINIMTGESKGKDSLYLGRQRERDEYGHITSKTALRQKEEMLDRFFGELKQTGDIEQCIEEYNGKTSDGDSGRKEKDSVDALLDRLGPEQPQSESENDGTVFNMDAPPRK